MVFRENDSLKGFVQVETNAIKRPNNLKKLLWMVAAPPQYSLANRSAGGFWIREVLIVSYIYFDWFCFFSERGSQKYRKPYLCFSNMSFSSIFISSALTTYMLWIEFVFLCVFSVKTFQTFCGHCNWFKWHITLMYSFIATHTHQAIYNHCVGFSLSQRDGDFKSTVTATPKLNLCTSLFVFDVLLLLLVKYVFAK